MKPIVTHTVQFQTIVDFGHKSLGRMRRLKVLRLRGAITWQEYRTETTFWPKMGFTHLSWRWWDGGNLRLSSVQSLIGLSKCKSLASLSVNSRKQTNRLQSCYKKKLIHSIYLLCFVFIFDDSDNLFFKYVCLRCKCIKINIWLTLSVADLQLPNWYFVC